MKSTFDRLSELQPQFFSAADLKITASQRQCMADLIEAIEMVVALPAYRQHVLAQAPQIARLPGRAHGVFMGYDFHLGENGPRLIEINTNAGGALLNAYLLAAHGHAAEAEALRSAFVAMFREEWRLERGEQTLRRIAIIDEQPASQFLAPEFELFRALFEAHGVAAVVADPGELVCAGDRLLYQGEEIDLVYNRLTDFALDAPVNAAIRSVFERGGVVLTPNPRIHALYADKRNLMGLSDPSVLTAWGVDALTQARLLAGVPRTVAVSPAAAESFWRERKTWFFKPASGFGSRAAYRGDKLTRRVFEEILQGAYIAQEIVPPSEHAVATSAGEVRLKADFRCYVYQGTIQLLAARLYQGQTTNFRTPGGGFAPVFLC